MKAFNLIDNREVHFDDATAPEWAVAYAYCEDHNMMSWLFSACHSQEMTRAYGVLPFTRGKHSIACGDWAALLTPTASAEETNTLAMSLWAEQIARGMGEPGEQADSACLDDWLLNRTYPIDTLSAAAAGDVAALAEVRAEAGLPVLS